MNKLIQKSNNRQQLLDNTIKFFNSTNRSTFKRLCLYRGKNGEACAIGREISDKLARHFDEISEIDIEGSGVDNPEVFKQLPKRLQRMGQLFLCNIQDIHDAASYWDESGLSKEGKARVAKICKTFKLENPTK